VALKNNFTPIAPKNDAGGRSENSRRLTPAIYGGMIGERNRLAAGRALFRPRRVFYVT
jgi:hypothetical protein